MAGISSENCSNSAANPLFWAALRAFDAAEHESSAIENKRYPTFGRGKGGQKPHKRAAVTMAKPRIKNPRFCSCFLPVKSRWATVVLPTDPPNFASSTGVSRRTAEEHAEARTPGANLAARGCSVCTLKLSGPPFDRNSRRYPDGTLHEFLA